MYSVPLTFLIFCFTHISKVVLQTVFCQRGFSSYEKERDEGEGCFVLFRCRFIDLLKNYKVQRWVSREEENFGVRTLEMTNDSCCRI